MGLRIFEPCSSPDGEECTLFDNPDLVHLAETRWYPSSLRIFDGSLIQRQTHLVDNDHCGKQVIVAIVKQVDGTDSPYPNLCHPYATCIFCVFSHHATLCNIWDYSSINCNGRKFNPGFTCAIPLN
ncbi:hypothetical protein B0H14DRAFT_2355211 [Mycena olivaceomarginata]|nr:hypothetical protein B0H14DRAFT_2355211 [Mycena olivaceomarginata]